MITLYLRKANGKGDRLQINPDNKVQELIESIKRTFVPSNGIFLLNLQKRMILKHTSKEII